MRPTFVITFVLSGCGGSEPQAESAPDPPSTVGPVCAAGETAESPCSLEGARCHPANAKDGCGLNGYECRKGRWEGLYTYCNPPEAFED